MNRMSVLIQNLKLVLRNIIANKKRSFLTCLGIIMGVAAVMGISSCYDTMAGMIGNATTENGIDNIFVQIYNVEARPKGITDLDIENILKSEDIATIGALNSLNEKKSVYFGKEEFKKTTVLGRSDAFFVYDNAAKVLAGRPLTPNDIKNRARVCLISKKMAKKAFGSYKEAVGKSLSIGGISFDIIGVDGTSTMALDRMWDDIKGDTVVMPYTTIQAIYGIVPRKCVVYTANADMGSKTAAYDYLNDYFENTLHLMCDYDYYIYFGAENLAEYEADQATQSKEQSLIAGICLLVGGIGIMNMMFVSVTERTREIGLRKALGATPARIQQQFMLESIVLSLVGGIVGALIGILISVIVGVIFSLMLNAEQPELELGIRIYISYGKMVIGLFFSMVVGVVFGYMPARKASMMNPIDALKL